MGSGGKNTGNEKKLTSKIVTTIEIHSTNFSVDISNKRIYINNHHSPSYLSIKPDQLDELQILLSKVASEMLRAKEIQDKANSP